MINRAFIKPGVILKAQNQEQWFLIESVDDIDLYGQWYEEPELINKAPDTWHKNNITNTCTYFLLYKPMNKIIQELLKVIQ